MPTCNKRSWCDLFKHWRFFCFDRSTIFSTIRPSRLQKAPTYREKRPAVGRRCAPEAKIFRRTTNCYTHASPAKQFTSAVALLAKFLPTITLQRRVIGDLAFTKLPSREFPESSVALTRRASTSYRRLNCFAFWPPQKEETEIAQNPQDGLFTT